MHAPFVGWLSRQRRKAEGEESPSEGILLGDYLGVIDGYHRAVRFWKRGAVTDKLSVYVPA